MESSSVVATYKISTNVLFIELIVATASGLWQRATTDAAPFATEVRQKATSLAPPAKQAVYWSRAVQSTKASQAARAATALL